MNTIDWIEMADLAYFYHCYKNQASPIDEACLEYLAIYSSTPGLSVAGSSVAEPSIEAIG